MKKVIDLSQKIYNKMPVHPYDEEAQVVQDRTFTKDGYNNTQINVGMHVGTHIDAPKHLVENGIGIDEYDLTKFMGKGCVINAVRENEIILKEEYMDIIENSDIVLIYTGYGECFNKEKYYGDNAPVLSKEFADYLVERQIKMVGMDLPSPDRYPFEIHKILLNNDILVVENLTNLDKLIGADNFMFFAFPLKIGAEASLTRAVAVME